jgi:hypothetical protein
VEGGRTLLELNLAIVNARDKKMSDVPTGLPDLSGAVQLFLQPAKLGLITKKQVDGYTQETINWVCTQVVRQAFTAQQLVLKPEGERAWKWYTLHTVADICLKVDDLIMLHGLRMRIMAKSDEAEYGFNEYQAIDDFTRVVT